MDSSENNELLNRPLVSEDVSDTDTIVNENENQISTNQELQGDAISPNNCDLEEGTWRPHSLKNLPIWAHAHHFFYRYLSSQNSIWLYSFGNFSLLLQVPLVS